MMVRSHAVTGGCGGAIAAATQSELADLSAVGTLLRMVAFAAAAAILADWDHPRSTASTSGGDIHPALNKLSDWVCAATRWTSGRVYAATRTGRDGKAKATHRYLTHTIAAALAVGGVVWLIGQWHPAALLPLLVALVWIGKDAFNRQWRFVALGCSAIGYSIGQYLVGSVTAGNLVREVAVAVTVGMLVHQLGDIITEQGAPWLWPLKVDRQRWFKVRLPEGLRLTTGSTVETHAVVPAAVFCTVCVVGAQPVLHGLAAVGAM